MRKALRLLRRLTLCRIDIFHRYVEFGTGSQDHWGYYDETAVECCYCHKPWDE